MQLVNDWWYRLYSWLLTVAGAIAFCLSLVALISPRFQYLKVDGFTELTLILAAALLIYRLFAYDLIKKRFELRAACLGLVMLTMLQSINLINSTGHLHSWHHVSWLIMILFGGMFGVYMILSLAVLTTLYMILIMTNVPGQVRVDWFSFFVLSLNFACAAAAHFFWRNLYVNQESQKIAQLSGALRSKQQQAAVLLESILDGVIVTDTEGTISLINSAAAKMTEWPVNEAIGINAKEVVKLLEESGKELPAEHEPFQQVLGNHEHIQAVLQLVGRQGKRQIVSVILSPILLGKEHEPGGVVAVLRDVSVARQEENRRADFISTASHEMRTPVAAIEGYLALALNENVSKIDSKARDFLVKAHESTEHLGKLFQDLLTSAKAEDGRLASHPVVVEMGTFLEKLSNDLRFAATKKGLGMEFVIGADKPTVIDASKEGSASNVIRPLYYVTVDPDRIREAISNLFDNAVKYTESGKVVIGLTGDDKVVQFYVRDTGPGIPPDDVPHLFQKFYRVDNSATRTVGGNGLGLFICQKIVELYNGRIWVESEIGKGSTFFINLPRLNSQQASELQTKEASTLPGVTSIS